MTAKVFEKAFEYKVIYIFTVEDTTHAGLVKIGDATLKTNTSIDKLVPNCRELNQASLNRIRQYTGTAGLTPRLLWSEIAVRTIKQKDNTLKLEAFRDHQVHSVLKNSGINPQKLSNSREWFAVDVETAKKAIEAVKHNYANLSNSDAVKHQPIIFRPEQADCIEKVVKHFKKADRFLINAKMRYGKTFVSLEIVKRCKFQKTIIMTHRPVVDDGWYEDFTKIFYGTDYVYGSKAKGNTVDELLKMGKPFIYFASVQDLRGSSAVGGKFTKNSSIFNTVWDCCVVDEAHEGTTTLLGEETVKAVFKEGQGTKFLALSGTPFNILQDYDADSIYTWDYIMEQECKSEWDLLHFGDSNPYDELPELRIYTYSLGDVLKNSNYITFEDKAFNFKEFFRTFTGDIKLDNISMPIDAEVGDFVHEADVWSFLNLMTTEDADSYYPYSNKEYRELFKHSLWMVPGVKEAKALKNLMLKHPVFGCGQFNIVNVAGNGDEEEASEEALSKVRNAIKEAGDDYTITLSCGKLTTGVTVKEWTAVFMLAGSFSTSAANYLQTIFRVQSPCNINGRIKENAYVFDFAPDRTLKMVSAAVSVSARAGKTKESDQRILGKFLNYCPVIGISGSAMEEYSATILLQQLKKAYAEKVVYNGFDDVNLYNDELLKLSEVDIKKFDKLKGIIGTSKAQEKQKDITVNNQGLTEEEYEETEKLKKKKKKELTPEEKARLEELKKLKKTRDDAISILRGISIRMPLLIYGADIPYDEEITIDSFVDIVDQASWNEFMPQGITKAMFKQFKKYYDAEVFIAAGRRIRNLAKAADTFEPTERVIKIASLFSCFKNPDKETVLTPWRVVNMHMSDTLGGWDFWDTEHKEMLDTPRYVDCGEVTKNTFGKENAQILEINSKTGLYPLYVVYSCYRNKLDIIGDDNLTLEEKKELWRETVEENLFVICKTPMAKTITKRTLLGYGSGRINAHCFDDLINTLKNKPEQFQKRVLKGSFWGKDVKNMRFDAIVGNPPYQESDGGGGSGRSASSIYPYFFKQSVELKPDYISMIMPSRWFNGGKGLDDFRASMLSDSHISRIVDFCDSKYCFPTSDIAGGICYLLWDKKYSGNCLMKNVLKNGATFSDMRILNEYPVLVSNNRAIHIIRKVLNQKELMLSEVVSSRKPFGLDSSASFDKDGDIFLRSSKGNGTIRRERINSGLDMLEKYKVITSKVSFEHAGVPDKDGMMRVLSVVQVLPKNSACTESYLVNGTFETEDEAMNMAKYLKTKFVRFLLMQMLASMNMTKSTYCFVPMQNFTKEWTDEKLYAKYSLSDEEIAFIDSMIKPMK
ncbi:Eco57I restriction-modification methylase domain-containing protein [Phascolarctobacterium succinatutens]|uniref:Eco57I restriction-modification methylase domain-containing protein n=1 Tax=Phascolarctobacterium succinatutens TaxID=626940 RepID=UPI0026F190C3|nr:Eco57I restriction-modification methylase domain-containing protein [Phascolarctobacterium succinatutens]